MCFAFPLFGPKTEASAELKRQIYVTIQGYRLPMTYELIVK